MKTRQNILILVLLAISTYSCGRKSGDFLPTQNLSQLTPSTTLTLTPVKMLTSTPTKKNTHTPTPVASSTPTTIPTLSDKDARTKLLELLDNNGNCRLPCLWGIIPGKTQYQEAQELMVLLSGISVFTSFSPQAGNIDLSYFTKDLEVNIDVGVLIESSIVNTIYFEAHGYRELEGQAGSTKAFDAEFFYDQIHLYSLFEVLSLYGRPTSILLSTLAEPLPPNRGFAYFNFLLLYPDQGILANYITEIRVMGDQVSGCPANAHVKMELHPSANAESFHEALSPSWQKTIVNNYQPLEEVTDLSIEDFYQTYREPTDQCLMTPSKYWPVPEK